MRGPQVDDVLQHLAAMRRLAAALVGDDRADDVVQDAVVQAMTTPPRRDGPLGGWLLTVVRGVAGKLRRDEGTRARHHRAAAAVRDDAAPAADQNAQAADAMRHLTAVVTALPEPYRAAIVARYLRERTPQQIAAETGESVHTVKSRLQRGLGLLRGRLAADDDADSRDWRDALAAAFGLPGGRPVATLSVDNPSTGGGLLIMSTTSKVLAAAAAVALGLLAWQLTGASPPAAAGADPVARETTAAPPPDPAAAAGSDAPGHERTAAVETRPPAAPAPPPAAADQVVVLAVDADTGAPIGRFALRETAGPGQDLLAIEAPLRFAGAHDGGRLVLPEEALRGRAFQLETERDGWLPAPWFRLEQAAVRAGERVIEVRVAAPVDVEVTVLFESGRAAVVGTVVEVVRPWLNTPVVDLKTAAVPPHAFRAQLDMPPEALRFLGTRGALLATGTTDELGTVHLRVPRDEALALRLLGPGHRPVVRTGWSVTRPAEAPVRLVELVTAGAAITGRVLPAAAMAGLRIELPRQLTERQPGMARRYAAGLWLCNAAGTAQLPPRQGFFQDVVEPAADGSFRFDGLDAGDWRMFLRYSAGPDRPAEADRMWSQVAHLMTFDLELPPVSALLDNEVRVVDVDLAPLLPGDLDAAVVWPERPATCTSLQLMRDVQQLPAGTLSSTSLLVGADGRVVGKLAPGRWQACFLAQDLTRVPVPDFEIRSATTTRIELVVDAVPARLRVLAPGGSPAADIDVTVTREPRALLWLWCAGGKTDTGGVVEFAALPNDELLRATSGHGDAEVDLGTFRVTADSNEVTLRLPPR